LIIWLNIAPFTIKSIAFSANQSTPRLAVIAEDVELQAQADFLVHLDCHAYLGQLFRRHLPQDELGAFLRRTLEPFDPLVPVGKA